MTVNGWIQIAIYFAVLTALVVPLGRYMARVFQDKRTFLTPVLGPAFLPVSGVTEKELADAAQLASLADETPEGRSIVVLAKEKYGIRGRDIHEIGAKFIPFTAQSRMSGVEINGSWVRKGAIDAVLDYLKSAKPISAGAAASGKATVSAEVTREVNAIAEGIAKSGGTPLAVAKDGRLLGVVQLTAIVKGGI